ncbi:MAG: hypothetical protein R3C45_18760 [Phycisphaerales bacterium]
MEPGPVQQLDQMFVHLDRLFHGPAEDAHPDAGLKEQVQQCRDGAEPRLAAAAVRPDHGITVRLAYFGSQTARRTCV